MIGIIPFLFDWPTGFWRLMSVMFHFHLSLFSSPLLIDSLFVLQIHRMVQRRVPTLVLFLFRIGSKSSRTCRIGFWGRWYILYNLFLAKESKNPIIQMSYKGLVICHGKEYIINLLSTHTSDLFFIFTSTVNEKTVFTIVWKQIGYIFNTYWINVLINLCNIFLIVRIGQNLGGH